MPRRLIALTLAASDNLIGGYIFGKMQADGVAPALASPDEEFLPVLSVTNPVKQLVSLAGLEAVQPETLTRDFRCRHS